MVQTILSLERVIFLEKPDPERNILTKGCQKSVIRRKGWNWYNAFVGIDNLRTELIKKCITKVSRDRLEVEVL